MSFFISDYLKPLNQSLMPHRLHMTTSVVPFGFGLLSLLAILYHITTCSEISSWPCRPLSGFSAVAAPDIAGVDRAGAGVVLAHSSVAWHESARLSWRCFIWSLGPKAPKAFRSWYLPSHGSRGLQCQNDRLAHLVSKLILSFSCLSFAFSNKVQESLEIMSMQRYTIWPQCLNVNVT